MFYSSHNFGEKNLPFVTCLIKQLVPSNKNTVVEHVTNMVFHEMERKER